MGFPVVAGDVGGPYTYPSSPPVFSSFPVVSGSVKVLFAGRSVAIFPGTQTAGGQIISATLLSVKTLVEGAPVILGGAVCNLSTGWLNGVQQATGAPTIQVN